jgi:hypothetical protein
MWPPSASWCARRKSELLADIDASRRLAGTESIDLLAIASSDESSLCQFLFAPGGSTRTKSFLLPVPTTRELEDLRQRTVEEFGAWFASWSRNAINPKTKNRMLLVKVDEGQSWLLRVPLPLFIRRSMPGFEAYESIQWIVTDRTFAQVVGYRRDLIALLEDAESLIRGTVVVLNTYPHLRQALDAELVVAGTTVAETILGQLQNVPFPDGQVSLRWLKNPGHDALTEALLNPDTRVFIADFESGSGEWELGESATRSEDEYFDLAPLHDRLSHIKLMRVFHCYSIFSPAAGATIGMKPADRSTIARQLLLAHAQFVEGATMKESYLEFLAFLFQFLMCGSLNFILRGRAGSGRFAWADAARICNRILEVQEFNQRVEEWL